MRVPSPVARLLDGFEDGGQLQPATALAGCNTIIMSSRLADHRNSLKEPYVKSRQRAAGTSDSSELVQLRRKSAAISRDFGTLLTAHERQEASVTDLRLKVRALRQQLEARDKSLELARRTLDRLSLEKGQLEAETAGTQAYVRKLEARLLSVKHAAELQQHCAQLKSQLDQMAHALHEAEGRAEKAEAEAQQSQLDAACVKRGLELAAEQLTKSVGAEVPSTLLQAVARGQEEALALSMQLSDSKQQQAHLAVALEQAREHLQAQQQALAQQQAEQQELRQRAEAADAALETQRAATSELRRVLDALKPKAGALAEERDSLRQQLELERTAAAEAQQQAKELQASLKHKRATEAALRDELRRALAGEGLTPNPAAPPGARSPAGARQRPAGAAGTVRNSSMRLRQQQQQSPAQQHSKRLGSMLSPSDQSAQKVVVRAAPWEQPEGAGARHAAAFSAKFSSQTRVGMQQQQQQQGHGAFSSSTNGRTPAKLSRIDRLGQLSEQRRGRQLPEQQQGQGQAAEMADWQDDVAGWQHPDSQPLLRPAAAGASACAGLEQQQTYGARQQGCEGMCGLLSPPSTGSRPVASQAAPGLPAASRQELLKLRVPSVAEIPLQDGQLMRVYASALDEQIAALETDLQALEASGAPSPITHLQLLAKAGASPAAAGPAGGQKQQAAAALNSPGQCIAPVPRQQKPDQAHAAAAAAAISAWRPNSVFNAAVQQLGSPDAVGPAVPGSPRRLSPAVWHSNPLASSPPKRPHQMPVTREVGDEQAPTGCAADEGALTVRQRPVAAAPAGSTGVGGPGAAGVDDWVWGQLQSAVAAPAGGSDLAWPPPAHLTQQAQGGELAGSAVSAASSPSLRLPAAESHAAVQQQQQVQQQQLQREEEQVACVPGTMAAEQPELKLQLRVAGPAVSQGSQGAADSGVHSLSRHWELPSPSPGLTDWLSNGEADIEQLEVTSTPPRIHLPQQQQQQQIAEAAWEAAAAAFAAQREPAQQQHSWMRPAELSGRNSSSWATQCGGASDSGSEADGSEQEASLRLQAVHHPHQAAHAAKPFLPGMAVVAHSPQPAPAAAGQGQGQGQVERQQVVQQTLFDLAGLDLSDVLH